MTTPQEAPPSGDFQSPVSSESDEGGATDGSGGGTGEQSSPEHHDQGFEIMGERSALPAAPGDGSSSTGKEATEGGRDKLLIPYGLSCVRELLRFLISLISTQDRSA